MFIVTLIVASVVACVIKNVYLTVDLFFNPKKTSNPLSDALIRILFIIFEIIAAYSLLRIVAILRINDLLEGFWMV